MASRIEIVSLCDRCGESHPGESITTAGCFGDGGSRRVLSEGEYVLAAQTCSECGGSFGQCFQSKIKCCPDCNHFPDGRDLVQWWDALAGGERP